MPVPTPEQLRLELPRHDTVAAACRALGSTKAGVYYRRGAGGPYQHPELVAICQAHVAAGRVPRDARGKAGEHTIALPAETVAKLDAEAARRGTKRPLRSRIARGMIAAALRRRTLPDPEPGDRTGDVRLDLGAVWAKLGKRLNTEDPQAIAGVVRAILAGSPPAPRATERSMRIAQALSQTKRRVMDIGQGEIDKGK